MLVEILSKHAAPSVRAIVFVEQRVAVTALANLLRSLPESTASYSVGSYVGTSTFANRKTMVANLAERREQERDLADFRGGVKNLIVATAVLEEGIDVSKSTR